MKKIIKKTIGYTLMATMIPATAGFGMMQHGQYFSKGFVTGLIIEGAILAFLALMGLIAYLIDD